MGHAEVETFIASGNVIFESNVRDTTNPECTIERGLGAEFGDRVDTFVRTLSEFDAIARLDPFERADPKADGLSRYVAFLGSSPDEDAQRRLTAFGHRGRRLRRPRQ